MLFVLDQLGGGFPYPQVASMGFQLFACPECEYQNVYVFVRRDGGL